MLNAVQHVRRMRGGAQSHLMRADDASYYVVKFQNNPQHVRVLANDFMASRLAECIGLPAARAEIIDVDAWLIEHTPELNIQLSARTIRCLPGLQFASRYVVDPAEGQVFDYLPQPVLSQVKNLKTFAGMLLVDKWTCNANGRQVAFWKRPRERKYTASYIDQGYCFNAAEWNFPDSPLRGIYLRNEVYEWVRQWDDFEPWLSRLEGLDPDLIGEIAGCIPPEWYEGDADGLEKLVTDLIRRRSRVRMLVEEFRRSSRQPFPAWTAVSVAVGHA